MKIVPCIPISLDKVFVLGLYVLSLFQIFTICALKLSKEILATLPHAQREL